MSRRTLASAAPRQSPSSSILASIFLEASDVLVAMAQTLPKGAGTRSLRAPHVAGNFPVPLDDYLGMTCGECREVLSADLDGEASELELEVASEHLARCTACRAFAASAGRLHRQGRLVPAPAVPDLTPDILTAIGTSERSARAASTLRPLRLVLTLVAGLEIATALPALVLGDDSGLTAHAARHAGAFALAIGIGFLYAAWRPRRASALLVVAGALVASLVLASVLDVATGHASSLSEVQHAPEVVGLVAAWLLSRRAGTDPEVRLA
jgi:predicted anti-sigma-YlaC factor YlaD